MELQKTDPEFMERFRNFAFDEVMKEENQQLDTPTRYLAILAALIGCGGVDAFQEMLPAALKKRCYAGDAQGDRLSGCGLPRLRTDASLFERDQ